MRKSRIPLPDFWLFLAAGTAGMALLFTILTSWSVSARLATAGTAVGVSLVWLSLWRRSVTVVRRTHEVVVCEESLVVDAESRGEVTLVPKHPVVNPKLIMSAHGRPVVVEDAWHEGVSVLASPKPVHHWRQGVVYQGILDEGRTLRVLFHNEGFTPARVSAHVVVPRGGAT